MSAPSLPPPGPVHKKRVSKAGRLLRLILSALDPRAWLHMVKVVNQYNYSHVAPLRKLTHGPGLEMSPNAILSNAENIVAGARLHVGAQSAIWAGPSARGRIVLGDDVTLGPRVFITAANYRFNDGSPVRSNAMDETEIIIGNDVWLGAGAMILPGARIGDGAVIGAASVLLSEVPPYAIAVGNPARVIGHRRRPGAEDTAPPPRPAPPEMR